MFDGNHTNPINGSESAKPKDNESTALKKENPALESHTISHIELANIIHGPPGTKRVIHTRQNETTNHQTPKNDSGLAFDNPRDRPSRNPLGPNVQMSGSAGHHRGGRIEKTVIKDLASTMKNSLMDRQMPHLDRKNPGGEGTTLALDDLPSATPNLGGEKAMNPHGYTTGNWENGANKESPTPSSDASIVDEKPAMQQQQLQQQEIQLLIRQQQHHSEQLLGEQ
ncbi:hypothetical protein SGCOL_003375 [Colletotrichum sp. CLE4]